MGVNGVLRPRLLRGANKDPVWAGSFFKLSMADIATHLNCPSIEGYKYDAATTHFWSCPLSNRKESSVLICFDDSVEIQFAKFPVTHKYTRFHTAGGKELLSKRVRDFLVSIKVTWTHSSTDTLSRNLYLRSASSGLWPRGPWHCCG